VSAPPRFRIWALATIVLLLGGCASGDSYSVDTADLAQRYLPTTRSVDYHPDSLRGFSVTEGDERYKVALENSYEGLHRRWSCTYQNLGTGRNRQTRSYATFWSKELSLASLEAEVGFSTITKKRARQLLQEQKKQYRRAIQIDLYWFEAEGNSLIAGPGGRVELEVDGERYRPTDESHGPLRETFLLQGDGRALYRLNTFYFARTVDGTDILEDTDGMTLTINRSGRRVRFAWEWEDVDQSNAHLQRNGPFGRAEAPVITRRSAADALPFSLLSSTD
jgi:hypothetical protein